MSLKLLIFQSTLPSNRFDNPSHVFSQIHNCRINGIKIGFCIKIQSAVYKVVDAVGNIKSGLCGGISVNHIKHSVNLIIRIDKRLLGNAACFNRMIVCQLLCIAKQGVQIIYLVIRQIKSTFIFDTECLPRNSVSTLLRNAH